MSHQCHEVIATNITDTSQAPKSKDICYRCKGCGKLLPSQPKDNMRCNCGNICIDVDYLRLFINDYSLFEVVRMTKPTADHD